MHCCPGHSLALKYALFYRYFLSRNALHTCKKVHTSVHVICKIATYSFSQTTYFEGNTKAIRLITDSSYSFTNIEFRIYDFFNQYLLWFLFWEKNLFCTKKNFVFLSNCSNWENFMKQIGGNIWWIRSNSLTSLGNTLAPPVKFLLPFVIDFLWYLTRAFIEKIVRGINQTGIVWIFDY